MNNKISIVIPTLNEEENIRGCLKSILSQIRKPLEVIVVDNGSKDKTREVVKSLKRDFKKEKINLRLIYSPKGNQTNAREKGVLNSKGEIIASLDAEAHPRENWILKIEKYFQDNKIVGVGGKSKFRNKGVLFNLIYCLNYYIRLLIDLYCIGGGNSAFRKSAFLEVKGYSGLEELRKKKNILYAKDDFFLSKKLEKIGKLKFCPLLNVSLLYRIRNKKTKNYQLSNHIKEIIKRAFLEILYDIRITREVKSSNL